MTPQQVYSALAKQNKTKKYSANAQVRCLLTPEHAFGLILYLVLCVSPHVLDLCHLPRAALHLYRHYEVSSGIIKAMLLSS